MNKIFLIIFLMQAEFGFSQDAGKIGEKPVIDSSAIKNWETLSYFSTISNDGKYFAYSIDNRPAGNKTLVIQSVDKSWKKEINGVSDCLFTDDNRQAIYKKTDTLSFVSLGTGEQRFIKNVSNFKLPRKGNKYWLAYSIGGKSKELILEDLTTGKQQHYTSVIDYGFNENGTAIVVKSEIRKDTTVENLLQYVSLADNKSITIWSSKNLGTVIRYLFDGEGKRLAFTVQKKEQGKTINSIWRYTAGEEKAVMVLEDQYSDSQAVFSVSTSYLQFSKNGQWLFFMQQKVENRIPVADGAKLDVWSYQDKMIQSAQLMDTKQLEFLWVANTTTNKIQRIEQENEKVMQPSSVPLNDFVIIRDNEFGDSFQMEGWWNSAYPKKCYLVSLADGTRKYLTDDKSEFSPSPGGRYLIFFDFAKASYFGCDIISGKIYNISGQVPALLSVEKSDKGDKNNYAPVGIAGWLEKDAALLVYDNYDIWQLDPAGVKLPVNITNGYGRSHHIKFRLILDGVDGLQDKSRLYFTAFNTSNKYTGFYNKVLSEKGDPELLIMAPYNFYRRQQSHLGVELRLNHSLRPLKAKNADVWIVQRMSASEAPNYFYSGDLKSYEPLTDIAPQKKYNWLTAELVNYKQTDGIPSQGILYKPENFDPIKKYPIIFYYYETMSDRLYDFPNADFIHGDINIPLMVSRGYLVFTPDIYYTIGKPGQGALTSILSAARVLADKSYIDATKMGLQGHSYGGFETNFIITHSNLFTAAVEGAGVSDDISFYGNIRGGVGVFNNYIMFETGQTRLGVTLWERPDLYIQNSPIFNLDKVTTPLLMMHNKKDGNVSWSQGVELFAGLRRLQKKVWMLQYDNEDHVFYGNSPAAKDYTTRFIQFFDHYLKGAPAPIWMTRGIPAKLKGIETGLEYDAAVKTPGKIPVVQKIRGK